MRRYGEKRSRCGFELVRRPDAGRLEPFEPPRDAGKHAARAHFVHPIHSLALQIEHRLAPPHHAGDLLDETRADLVRVRERRRRHIGDKRHRRRLDVDLGQGLAHDIGGGLHQRAMKGRAHRQQHRPAHAELGRERNRPLHRRARPTDHHLPRSIVVGRLAHFALRRQRLQAPAPSADRRRAAPPWPPRPPAPPPASRDRASSRAAPCPARSTLPAAASAEYSPSEWPATEATRARQA